MTASQSAILLKISKNGWIICKIEMMESGRMWVVAEKKRENAKNTLLDKSIWGSVGKTGKIEVEYSQFMYREKVDSLEILEKRLTEQ